MLRTVSLNTAINIDQNLISTLNTLSWLRLVALLAQVGYLFFIRLAPSPVIIMILSLQGLILLLSYFYRRNRLSQKQLFALLLFDLLLFMAYILQTGGISNPLISLSFLQLIIACLSFSRAWAFAILLVAIGFYSYLLWRQPMSHHMDFNHHLVGMWAVYIVSASLLFFVISKQLRDRQLLARKFEQLKAKRQRDEYLMSLGLSNADIAHRLNTPLSSLILLAENLEQLAQNAQFTCQQQQLDWQQDLELLQQQLKLCQYISQQHFKEHNAEAQMINKPILVESFLNNIVRDFKLLRPEIQLQYTSSVEEDFHIISNGGLKHALLNLMDNAANASQDNDSNLIELQLRLETNQALLTIKDNGVGMSADSQSFFGYQPNQDSEGLGIGSLLASANLERCGVTFDILEPVRSEADTGLRLRLRFPEYVESESQLNQAS
ncbi:sensor histidine kinase KdpD [Kangiella sp. TOML190]|uniref:sensor histidine kinase n=1 Tax=Kangiella sp. TOML190 TaxID=2931351 RepID=UPI00203E122B|nr:ATP-binding protein [Kangiella sp. TOML190]